VSKQAVTLAFLELAASPVETDCCTDSFDLFFYFSFSLLTLKRTVNVKEVVINLQMALNTVSSANQHSSSQ
jgi:hypothetical protein